MFQTISRGIIIGKILNINFKESFKFNFKLCVKLDNRDRIIFANTFEKKNLYPYINLNENDQNIKNKMLISINTNKKFIVKIKLKDFEKQLYYFNIESIQCI